MADVSPGLHAAIKKAFEKRCAASAVLQKYIKALNNGELAGFKGAYDYTELLGTCLADSFQEVLSSDVLPDGKMYFNIAKSVVEPFLAENYEAAVDAAAKVEEVLNKRANIGMKPVRPGVDQDKINGIINRLSSEEHFDDVKWILDEPVVNLTQSGVDDTIRENVEFHAQSGLSPTVTRISTRKCCEWCSRLAGRYKYPNVPKDVYRRHENCRCTVEYDPGDGKKQNAWSKRHVEKPIAFENIELTQEPPAPPKVFRNVMPEFMRDATSGRGNIDHDIGYSKKSHGEEIECAEWIHRTFGGNIKLLTEANVQNEKTPDYLWNDQLWDLKSIHSSKAVNSALRKGIKQIESNPGGIIFDLVEDGISLEEAINVARRRLLEGHYDISMTMIFKKGDKILKILST